MSSAQPAPDATYPPGPYGQPPPPKKKRRTWLIVLAILAVLGLGGCLAVAALVGSGVDDPPVTAEPSAREPRNDASKPTPSAKPSVKPYKATITKCVRGEYGTFDVVVKITNNTDDLKEYFFDIGLYDSKDNTVGEGIGSVKVKPGKSATTETYADLSDPDYKGKVKCEVEVTDF